MQALPEFTVSRPPSWGEAAAALVAADGARALAGGTDLLPNLRRGLRAAPALVDLSGVAGFDALERLPDATLLLGAGVTLARLAAEPVVLQQACALAEAARSVAAPAHRSAATLGGNLCQDTRCVYYNQGEWWRASNAYCLKYGGTRCHVAPQGERCHAAFCSDLAPALLALHADVEVVSARGATWLPLHTLYRDDGASHLALAAGELVARIRIPAAPGVRSAFAKARLREGIDFPLAAVAVALAGGVEGLQSLRIAVAGTNPAPVQIDGVDALLGRPVDDALLDQLAKLVQKQVTPMRTTATPANYRRQVAMALGQRLVRRLAAGAAGDD